MQVHTFRAESLQAALQQVRHVLGPDASVLDTRLKRPGPLRWFSRSIVEVDAAADVSAEERPRPSSAPRAGSAEEPAAQASISSRPECEKPSMQTAPGSNTLLAPPGSGSTTSPAMLEIQAELLASGVPGPVVSGLLDELDRVIDPSQREDAWALRGRIGQLVGSQLKVAGSVELRQTAGGRPMVMAVVGPTGVGKTTTLAKIAAGFRFDLGCRVGLMALDTCRLGAVDQLLQYAELVSAPLEVVSAPEQIQPALERLGQCDLVLLDTAGRAPRDTQQLRQLQRCLELARPDTTQLVVSATTSIANVEQTLTLFSPLQPSNLLITKLDESVAFGSWLSLLRTCPLPISYLTTGQQVPQDIVVASTRRLTSLLLGTQAGTGPSQSPSSPPTEAAV